MKTIVHVVGARPNYMKIAPILHAFGDSAAIRHVLVNTGQHYDESMAGIFLREFALPTPHRDLAVGSGSHAVQTANVMIGFETVCAEYGPDLVVVVGDVNSTMAATIVAAKLMIPVAHVEAGLRSFDRTMPEEINRIVTDRLADLLLTPSPDADQNLLAEGADPCRIRRVGNVMIDTLRRFLPMATLDRVQRRLAVRARRFAVLTLHRPSNVDVRQTLAGILEAMHRVGQTLPIVFPVHPRTLARIAELGLPGNHDGLMLTEPLGYLDFLSLVAHARVVMTDSGGLQEESTALGIPCLTLRENTERPVTVTEGTNRVAGTDPDRIVRAFEEALETPITARCPELWDGHAGERVVQEIHTFLNV